MSQNLYELALKLPLLSPEEETALWSEYFSEKTSELRKASIKEKIITSHLKLAISYANKWKKSGIPFDELFGEACVGLSNAFKNYSPDKGARFCTFLHFRSLALKSHATILRYITGKQLKRSQHDLHEISVL